MNSIHPGAIETPIWVKLAHDGQLPGPDANAYGDAMDAPLAASVAATPLKRAGSPQDVAAGIVFLASEGSRFVAGTELVIDAGVMAG